MFKVSSSQPIIIGVLAIALMVVGVSWYSQTNTDKQKIERLEKKVKTLSKGESDVKKEYRQLWDDYEELYTEKNGTANDALLKTTSELFTTVFSYRSEKEEDSVANRKKRGEEYATNQALNGVFPKDATDAVASVSTVSKLTEEPEVYIMSSNDKEIKALVVLSYSVSIAGSEAQKGTFMYKISFNPQQNKITSTKNLGELNLF